MYIFENILSTIGNTPLVKINKLNTGFATIVAKVESFNPAGSVKDRPAFNMIKQAQEKGLIDNNTVIIEHTSGNTVKGYKLILTMPETMSIERRKLLSAYGAEIVLTEGELGMQGAVDKANQLHNEIKNSFIPQQFSNPDNPAIHEETTAKEILDATEGKVDIIVAGVGTGGTISGISRTLKKYNPNIKAVAVEPESSPLLSKGFANSHKIQGIGANFVPDNFDGNIIDEIITVSNEDALNTFKDAAKKEGIFCGISSGAALFSAIKLSERVENKGKLIVVILPDTGERYLSIL